MNTDRATILGCAIDRLDMGETVARCDRVVKTGGYAQHMSINAAKLVSLQDDDEMRDIVARCELVNADGQAVVWASRILNDPLPCRVAGIDLMRELLALAEQRGYGVYILGARDEVLRTAVERIRADHPALRISGFRDGYFSDDEAGDVCAEIKRSGAEILFVAMSSPRKEYFLGRYGRPSGARITMGVGGSIDVIAGITKRAPALWQRLGLEWLYRLLQEPRRLFRRYLVTNARFGWLVARERRARRLAAMTGA